MKNYVKKRLLRNCLPTHKNNITEINQHMYSDKMLYIIYADIESLIKKIHDCKINSEHFSKERNIFLADIQWQLFGQLMI